MAMSFPVRQLKTGMFIDCRIKNTKVALRVGESIPAEQLIEKLLNDGIQYVDIDWSRSRVTSGQSADASTRSPVTSPLSARPTPPASAVKPTAKPASVTASVTDRPATVDTANTAAAVHTSRPAYNPKPVKPASFSQEMPRAKSIFGEAKDFVRNALDKAKEGGAVELDAAENFSEQLIDSVSRNQSALLCVMRLRTSDDYLYEHSVSVATLTTLLAKALKLPDQTIRDLTLGALLHDVGKILTPADILHKPGKLSDEEFSTIQQHAAHTEQILRRSNGIPPLAMEVAINHHERPDGKGYPRGLSGTRLSRYSRIISIADCYDAMTADRTYRRGMTPQQALKILLEGTPDQFDSELVATFIRCIGVYPVGSLIKLKSQRIGLVVGEGIDKLSPQVKLFYNARFRQHIPVEHVCLNEIRSWDPIAGTVSPEKYDIDLAEVI